MPNSDRLDKEDRQVTDLDQRERVIVIKDNIQELPTVDIYDEPVRYFKANKQWTKIIFGLVNWLEQTAFWPDAVDDRYSGIQQIMKYEQGIDLSLEIDCDLLEACIIASETIINLQNQITEQNTIINNLTEEITRIDNEQATDGVDYPPNPAMADAGNDLCKSAAYIALRIADAILVVWDQAKTLTIQEFTDAILSVIWFDFEAAVGFWQYAATVANPDLGTDAQAYVDQIRDALFCAQLDKALSLSLIDADTSIPLEERVLWMAVLENYRQVQIDEWAAIGTLSEETPDCSEGCPWIVVFDFSGSYTPVGDETLIISGNTWSCDNGAFVAGQGYVANADQMHVYRSLPEQCRLLQYHILVKRGATCSATDQHFFWRGAAGDLTPQYDTSFIRCVSATFTTQNYTVAASPVMPTAAIYFDGFLCGGGAFGQTCGYIKLIGTGAYPQS